MGKGSIALIGVFALLLIVTSIMAGMYIAKAKLIPFRIRGQEYAIGIYTGSSPFAMSEHRQARNPVIRAKDVTDVKASFVADPFMIEQNGIWYIFFEVLNKTKKKGEIGLATSEDGLKWTYKQIVLDEPHHLSYPYVFKWNNEIFMMPESCVVYGIQLYKADNFPYKWKLVKTLIKGNYFDSSIVQFKGKWWIFTSDRDDILHLFYADDLLGPWTEHQKSPIVFRNAKIARCGGRILAVGDKVYRFAQECDKKYGYQVRAFEITELTRNTYEEHEASQNPVLRPSGKGWNGEKMHHIDAHQTKAGKWIACVDGVGTYFEVKRR